MNEKIERAENDSMTERDNLEWAKTRKKATLKDIKKHYWCCRDCATEAGGELFDTMGITMTEGMCKICKTDNVTLIPWVDFDWPTATDNSNLIAKISRD